MKSNTIIRANGVRKQFDGRHVLDGVDLTVRSGECLALMGPNGTGKSVLMSCLTGSAEPTEGTVRLLDGASPGPARGRVSVMTQGDVTLPSHTGRENIEFYRDLHPRGTDRWRELTKRLDIRDDLNRPVREYSGGMKRKLELVIALTPDVPLYFLDEPTAELDPSVVRTVHELLDEFRSESRTVVLTSHSSSDANVADRVAFITGGEIVASGSPEALRSALPDVVRSTGTPLPRDELLNETVLENGSETRGFLPEDTTVSDLERHVEGTVQLETPPTHADLFDYYTKVAAG